MQWNIWSKFFPGRILITVWPTNKLTVGFFETDFLYALPFCASFTCNFIPLVFVQPCMDRIPIKKVIKWFFVQQDNSLNPPIEVLKCIFFRQDSSLILCHIIYATLYIYYYLPHYIYIYIYIYICIYI